MDWQRERGRESDGLQLMHIFTGFSCSASSNWALCWAFRISLGVLFSFACRRPNAVFGVQVFCQTIRKVPASDSLQLPVFLTSPAGTV